MINVVYHSPSASDDKFMSYWRLTWGTDDKIRLFDGLLNRSYGRVLLWRETADIKVNFRDETIYL